MIKNVGKIDRTIRLMLAAFLIWLGLFQFNGLHGNIIGILIALISLMPLYITVTGSCPVFRWFKIHTLSKSECEKHGEPYTKELNVK